MSIPKVHPFYKVHGTETGGCGHHHQRVDAAINCASAQRYRAARRNSTERFDVLEITISEQRDKDGNPIVNEKVVA